MTKRVLITGGASGLGKALAMQFARQGAQLLITDLHAERGQAVQAAALSAGAETAEFMQLDVADFAGWQQIKQWLSAQWQGLDVLVNNAGVAIGDTIQDTEAENWQWLMQINVNGVFYGCKICLPFMSKGAVIVNIASIAGVISVPYTAAYNASKAAVVSLSETLKIETHQLGIQVKVACPAFFNSQLHESIRARDPEIAQIGKQMLTTSATSSDHVAGYIIKHLYTRKFLLLPDRHARLGYLVRQFLPWLYWRSMYRVALDKTIKP